LPDCTQPQSPVAGWNANVRCAGRFGDFGQIAHETRAARRHRFQQRDRMSFVRRRHDEEIDRLEQPCNVVAQSQPLNLLS
jgi:hypothetical protein